MKAIPAALQGVVAEAHASIRGMPARQKLTYVDDARSVGRRIRQARTAAGLSQRDLSFPGCTPAYISRIEKGERVPSLQILREFATRLGASEGYLATGREAAAEAPLVSARAALRLGEVAQARESLDAALAGARTDAERAAASALYGEVALYESDAVAAIEALERALQLIRSLSGVTRRSLMRSGGRTRVRTSMSRRSVSSSDNYERARTAKDLTNKIRFGALLANAYSDSGNFARSEEVLGDLIAEVRVLLIRLPGRGSIGRSRACIR